MILKQNVVPEFLITSNLSFIVLNTLYFLIARTVQLSS